ARGTGLSSIRIPNPVQRVVKSVLGPVISFTDHTACPAPPKPSSDFRGMTPNAGGNVNNQRDIFANRTEYEDIPEHLLRQVQPSEPNVAMLVEMGFPRDRAMRALAETGDSVELAL